MDLSFMDTGGLTRPADTVISGNDPFLSGFLPFGEGNEGDISSDDIEITLAPDEELILKLKEARLTEKKINNYFDELPEAVAIPQGNKLRRWFMRRIILPIFMWINVSPNPRIRTAVIVTSVAGILSLALGAGVWFGLIPFLKSLCVPLSAGALSTASARTIMKSPLAKVVFMGLATIPVIKKIYTAAKKWVDKKLNPKKEKTLKVSEEILGFTVVKKTDETIENPLETNRISIKILQEHLGLSEKESPPLDIIKKFSNVATAPEKEKDEKLKLLIDETLTQIKQVSFDEYGKPDPDKAMKYYEFALLLEQHRLLIKNADKRAINQSIVKIAKQIFDIKEYGIDDVKPAPDTAKNIEEKIKSASRTALGEDRNFFVIYLWAVSERARNDEIRIILAELALRANDEKEAAKQIRRISSASPALKAKLREDLRILLEKKAAEKAKEPKKKEKTPHRWVIFPRLKWLKDVLPIAFTLAFVFKKDFGRGVYFAIRGFMPSGIASTRIGGFIAEGLAVTVETFKTIGVFLEAPIPFISIPVWGAVVLIAGVILAIEGTAALSTFLSKRLNERELHKVSEKLDKQKEKEAFPYFGWGETDFFVSAALSEEFLDRYERDSDPSAKREYLARAEKIIKRLKKGKNERILAAALKRSDPDELKICLQVLVAELRLERIKNTDKDSREEIEETIAETIKKYAQLPDIDIDDTFLIIISPAITKGENWKKTRNILNKKLDEQEKEQFTPDNYAEDREITEKIPKWNFERLQRIRRLEKLKNIYRILGEGKDTYKKELERVKDEIKDISAKRAKPIGFVKTPEIEEKEKTPEKRIKENRKKIRELKKEPGVLDFIALADAYYELALAHKEKSKKPGDEDTRLAEFYLHQAQDALLFSAQSKTERLRSGIALILKEELVYRGPPALFMAVIAGITHIFHSSPYGYNVPLLFAKGIPIIQFLAFSMLVLSTVYFVRAHKEETFLAPESARAVKYPPAILGGTLSVILPYILQMSWGFSLNFAVMFLMASFIHMVFDFVIGTVNETAERLVLGYAISLKDITPDNLSKLSESSRARWNDITRNLISIKISRGTLLKGVFLKNKYLKKRINESRKDADNLSAQLQTADSNEKKEEIKQKLLLSLKNINDLSRLLFSFADYDTLYGGIPLLNRQRNLRREYLNDWLIWTKAESEKLKQEKLPRELKSLEEDLTCRLSGISEKHFSNERRKKENSVKTTRAKLNLTAQAIQNARDELRDLKKQLAIKQDELMSLQERLSAIRLSAPDKAQQKNLDTITLAVKTVEDRINTLNSEITAAGAKFTSEENKLKEKQNAFLTAEKTLAIFEITNRLRKIKDASAIRQVLEEKVLPIVSSIANEIEKFDELTPEDAGAIIKEYIAPIVDALISEAGSRTKAFITPLIVPFVDAFFGQKRKASIHNPLLDFKTDIASGIIGKIAGEIKSGRVNESEIISIREEIQTALRLEWIKNNDFLNLPKNPAESNDDYLKRKETYLNNANNIYENAVKPFINDSPEIQNAAVKTFERLLNNHMIRKDTINSISRLIGDKLSGNRFLLSVKAYSLEKTSRDTDGKIYMEKWKKLRDIYIEELELASKKEKEEYEQRLVGHLYLIVMTQDERQAEINSLLEKITPLKFLLNRIFDKEMNKEEEISPEVITAVFTAITKKNLIGEEEGDFTFDEILGMLKKVLRHDNIPKKEKGNILRIIAVTLGKDDLANTEKLIKLCEELTKQIETPEEYKRSSEMLHIFYETLVPLLENQLAVVHGDSEKIKTQKDNLTILAGNLLLSIVYSDIEHDAEKKVFHENNKNLFNDLALVNEKYEKKVKLIKEDEKKRAEKRLRQAKEKLYRAYMSNSRAFEINEKYNDAIKEEEKIIELFKEEIEATEKDELESFSKSVIIIPKGKTCREHIDSEINKLLEEKQILARRLVALNNRVINTYKRQAKLYAKQGKTSESQMAEGAKNRWCAMHRAETVSDIVGNPWEAYIQALENMIKASTKDPYMRKKYADMIARGYFKSKSDLKKAEKENEKTEKAFKDITVEITGIEKDKKETSDKLTALTKRLMDSQKELDEAKAERVRRELLNESAELEKAEIISVSLEIKEIQRGIKEESTCLSEIDKNLKDKVSKKKEIEEQKQKTEKALEKAKKESEKSERETGKKTEIDVQKEMLDDAIQKYLDTIEMAVFTENEKKNEIDACVQALKDYVYHDRTALDEMIRVINVRLDVNEKTQTDRQKRNTLKEKFRNLELQLIESAIPPSVISVQAEISNCKNALIKGETKIAEIQFSHLELLKHVTQKLKTENKNKELAETLLSVFLNKAIDANTRAEALKELIDLVYAKLNLSVQKELPEFDAFFRGVLKDVLSLPLVSEDKTPIEAITRAVKDKRAAKNIRQFITDLKLFYANLKTRHLDKKQDSWHEMTDEDKKIFVAANLPGEFIPDEARKEIQDYEFSISDSKQLIKEADDLIKNKRDIDYVTDVDAEEKTRELLDAAAKCEEAVKLDTESAKARRKLAEIRLALRDYKGALESAKEAVQKDLYDFEAHKIVISIHKTRYETNELYKAYMALAKAYKEQAEKDKEKGKIDDISRDSRIQLSLDMADNASGVSPNKADHTAFQLELYKLQGKDDLILPELNQLLKWIDFSKARKFISFRMKKKMPEDLDAVSRRLRRLRSKILIEKGNAAKALPDLKKLGKAGDTSKELYLNLARSFESRYEKHKKTRKFIIMALLISTLSVLSSGCGGNIWKLMGITQRIGIFADLYLPSLTEIFGIIAANYAVFWAFFIVPANEQNRVFEYYDKAVSYDTGNIEVYQNAVNFSEKCEDEDETEKYLRQAIENVNLNKIIDKTEKIKTEKDLDLLKSKLLEITKERVKNKLEWKFKSFRARRVTQIQKLQETLNDISAAKELAESITDPTERRQFEDSLNTFAAEIHERLVDLYRRQIALLHPSAEKRYSARFALAKALLEYAKALPENTQKRDDTLFDAIIIMENIRGREGAPLIARDLSEAYYHFADYATAVQLDPLNANACLELGQRLLSLSGNKKDAAENMEKALELGLNDENSLIAYEKLIAIYESPDPAVMNILKAEYYKEKENELKRKKDAEKEKYRVSKQIKRKEALKQRQISSASKKAEEWVKLKTRYNKKMKKIAEISKERPKIASETRKDTAKIKEQILEHNKEIGPLFYKIVPITLEDAYENSFEMMKFIYSLKARAEEPGKRDSSIALLEWSLEYNKNHILAEWKEKTDLVSAEMLVDKNVELTPPDRLEKAKKILEKFVDKISQKTASFDDNETLQVYLLLANISLTSDNADEIKTGYTYLRKALQHIQNPNYGNEAVKLFCSLTDKLERSGESENFMPEDMEKFLTDLNNPVFQFFILYSPENIKKIAAAALNKRFNVNKERLQLINVILQSKILSPLDKNEVLRLLTGAIYETAFVRGKQDIIFPAELIKTLKNLKKLKTCRQNAYVTLAYINKLEKGNWRAWWNLFMARMYFRFGKTIPQQDRPERAFRLGVEEYKKGNFKNAVGWFEIAEKTGYKTAELYTYTALAERDMAKDYARYSPLEADMLFKNAVLHIEKALQLDKTLVENTDFLNKRAKLYENIIKFGSLYPSQKEKTVSFIERKIGYLEKIYELSVFVIPAEAGIYLTTLMELFSLLPSKERLRNRALSARLTAIQGISLLQRGEISLAESAFYRALWIDPRCVIARIGLRDLALHEKNGEEAIAQHEKAKELDSTVQSKKSPRMALIYGEKAKKALKPEEKFKYLNTALGLDRSIERKTALADAYFNGGKFQDAKNLLQEITESTELDEKQKEEIEQKLKDIETLETKIKRSILREANAEERLAKFNTKLKKINSELDSLKIESSREFDKKEKEKIDQKIQLLENEKENLLGKPEREIFDKPYMKAAREEAVKHIPDETYRKEKEAEKQREQVSLLLARTQKRVEREVKLAKEKKTAITTRNIKPATNYLISAGNTAVRSGNLTKANVLYQEAEKLDPQNTELISAKRALQLREGKFSAVIAKDKSILEGKNTSPEEKTNAGANIISAYEEEYRDKTRTIKKGQTPEDWQKHLRNEQIKKGTNISNVYDEMLANIMSLSPLELQNLVATSDNLPLVLSQMFSFWQARKENRVITELTAFIITNLTYDKNTENILELCVSALYGAIAENETMKEGVPEKDTELKGDLIADTDLLESLNKIALLSFNKQTLENLIDLVFLTDGAYSAIFQAIMARTKKEDLLFLSTLLSHIGRVFSRNYIDYIENSIDQKHLTFLPGIKDDKERTRFFESLENTLKSIYENVSRDEIDSARELNWNMALAYMAGNKTDEAIPFLIKSLNSPYRQNARRLLIHAHAIKGDNMAAWHVFSAMRLESPRSSLTENARYELGIEKKDNELDILWEMAEYGRRPILITPANESVIYASLPVIASTFISRLMGFGLLPQALIIMFASASFGMVFTYQHKTGRKTAALISLMNTFILPITVRPNFVWFSFLVFLTAYLIHASINLFAFITNIQTGQVTIPYGEIKPLEKKTPQAIVEIDSKAEDMLARLSLDYPDIEFAVVDPSTRTLRVLAQDDNGAQAEIPEFRIDMSPEDLEKNVNDIAKYVRRAAFIQQYPYEAGLDSVSVNKMNKEKLQDTVITLKMVLSPESSIDNRIDTILTKNFTPPVLKQKENTSMEGRVEDELIKTLPILKANGLIPEKQAVVYDLRDVSKDVFAKMVPGIERIGKADENVYTCLIDPENRFQEMVNENIFCLTSVSGETPIIDQARDFLAGKLKLDDFALASISVVTPESTSGDYMDHIEAAGIKKANFVMTGRTVTGMLDPETEHILKLLPVMALMGIVKRSLSQDKRANIVAVDCSESILTKIKRVIDIILTTITRLNINDEITGEISAIIQIARSV